MTDVKKAKKKESSDSLPSEEQVSLAIAKLLLAAAWVDGSIDNRELSCLKDLIFQLPLDPKRFRSFFELSYESPPIWDERTLLLEEARRVLVTEESRERAIQFVIEVLEADGEIRQSEEEFLKTLRENIDAGDDKVHGQLGSLARDNLRRREATMNKTGLGALETLRQTVFDQLINVKGDEPLDIELNDLRKLTLSALLLSRVARADQDIERREVRLIGMLLNQRWSLTETQSRLLAKATLEEKVENLDIVRLCRHYYESTTAEERKQFVGSLYVIAHADGRLTPEERDAVRYIAKLLRVKEKGAPVPIQR